jgi:hypothetical protein
VKTYYIRPEVAKVVLVIVTLILLAMSVGAPNAIGWPSFFRF